MDALIETRDLCHYYGDHCAVQGLDFALHRGDVLGLLGPNGAGKSTTLRMLAGGLLPDSGSIRLRGIDLLQRPVLAKRYLGYLPEHPPLYPDLRVDEFLSYCARLQGIPTVELPSAVTEVKSRCGLDDCGRRLIADLSKGYQQRLGIAQAIIHKPALVILDEPTVGLDPNQIRQIRALIRELGEDRGVVLSTHLLSEVESTCNRVLILHQGRQVYTGELNRVSRPMAPPTLILGLAAPPDPGELLALPAVHHLDALEPGRFRLYLDQREDPRSGIAKEVVHKGWGLLEMSTEGGDLEQIFSTLTRGEAL